MVLQLLVLGFGLLIFGALLFIVLESKVKPHAESKGLIGLLIRRPVLVELVIQLTFIAGFVLPCSLGFTVYPSEPVMGLSFALFPFFALPPLVYTFHRRIAVFREIVIGYSEFSTYDTMETIEPRKMALLNLMAWMISLVLLLTSFAMYGIPGFDVIRQVLLLYGLFGLVLFTSPMLFSLPKIVRREA